MLGMKASESSAISPKELNWGGIGAASKPAGTIAVGPVQEFIAAARRTRDLWFGSYLLSEISRAVAKAVADQGGQLIFPASCRAESGANVILAELPSGVPKEVAANAKQAAHKRWAEFALQAYREACPVIRQDIWSDQVHDVIEVYAAWVQHTDPKNYGNDRKQLMRLLGARKNLRDFLPAGGDQGTHTLAQARDDGKAESNVQPQEEARAPTRSRWSRGLVGDVGGRSWRRLLRGQGEHPTL